MKKIVFTLFILSTVLYGIPVRAQENATWKEFAAFHEVISQTFHPSEEGKLQPIRTRSQELLNKAMAWKNSTAPAGYNKKVIKKSLQDLVKQAGELNKLVKENAADKVIKEKISAVHDLFHEALEKCPKCEEEEKSEH